MAESGSRTDQKIIESLHIDARASWQKIATALGLHERSVARRAQALLASGALRIRAITIPARGAIVLGNCGLGQARMASKALCARPETMWAHITTGTYDLIADVAISPEQEVDFYLDEIPALAGLAQAQTLPVLEYLRTARNWRPGILSTAERSRMLVGVPAPVDLHVGPGVDLDQRDLALLAALREDGRRTFEELGRIIGISDVTARRRVEALRASGILQLRAVFDPGLIGKDAEYILVCRTHPSQVAALSAELRADDSIKYAVRIAGPWQFLIKVDLAHRNSLDEFLAAAPWAGRITDGDTFIAIHTDKRNAVSLT